MSFASLTISIISFTRCDSLNSYSRILTAISSSSFNLLRSIIILVDCLFVELIKRFIVFLLFVIGPFSSQITPLIRKSGFLFFGVFTGIINSTLKPCESKKSTEDSSCGWIFTPFLINLPRFIQRVCRILKKSDKHKSNVFCRKLRNAAQ